MLVCSVSLRPPRSAIAATIVEAVIAADALGTGNVVFATLVDDPASVNEIVDAYLGEIMLEAANAIDVITSPMVHATTVVEAATAADTQSTVAPSAPLDAVANVTGAWSFSRDLLTSFASGTRYTKSGTAIITLEDQSVNNSDLTDGGATIRRPVETTAFPTNVLCADFDGINQYLSSNILTMASFITASSGAMVCSVIIDAVTVNSGTSYNNHGVMADSQGYMGLYARALSGVTLYSYNYDGNEDASSTVGSVATPYVFMWRHHGGNVYVSINGGTEVSLASGNTASLAGSLFIAFGSANRCNMKFAEGFTTSDGSQTAALAAAIANMKTYIGA